MSHELEMIDGVAQMAYTADGEKPWHGLGIELPEDATPVEMMKAAGLDWSVEKRDNFHRDITGEFVKSGTQTLIRSTDSKILTQVGENWNPVQNSEAFDFFEEFCQAGSMKMHTAGSLFDGKKIWALAKVASDFTVFGNDRVEGYLLFSNPHQYGHSVDVRFTPIRVVCNNTLTMSLKGKANNAARFTHVKEFDKQTALDMLGIATDTMDEYKQVAEFLGSKRMTDTMFKEFLGNVFGAKEDGTLKRTGQLAYDALETQPGADFAKGTFWQGLNAVTYVTDHVVGRSADSRLNNVWFGHERKRKLDAVKTAIKMAEMV